MKNDMTLAGRLTAIAMAASLAVSVAASLSGCGAGAGTASMAIDTDPAASAALYADVLSYCGAAEPASGNAQSNGLEITHPSHYGNPSYETTAVASPRGSDADLQIRLDVGTSDYRGVQGSFIPAGYMEPAWKMGVSMASLMPARSAACVAGLAKIVPPAVLPGWPGPQPTGSTLTWRSKWAPSVAVGSLSGAVIDGFEFVSTFVPANALAFFVVPKSRVTDTQSLSICYLAPASSSWDCAAAAVADAGTNRALSRPAPKPGVYVLVTPHA